MGLLKKAAVGLTDTALLPLAHAYVRFFRYRWRKAVGRAILLSIRARGTDVRFHGEGDVVGADRLTIGDYVRVGKGFHFNCLGGVAIGANTQISRDVTIYSSMHEYDSTASIPYDDNYRYGPVSIGRSVWIGMGVKILPGVTIGDGAIIGMGTVVTKDVRAGEIVVGFSQRSLKYRDMHKFEAANEKDLLFGKVYKDL